MTNYEEYKLNDASHWEWHTTFVGQHMQHNYRLYHILDAVIQANPQIKSIIEIGTGNGALTTYLALWGIKLSIPVMTVDNNPSANLGFLQALRVSPLVCDEKNDAAVSEIKRVISSSPTLFLCDGGHKENEFNFWGLELPSGSVIAAHDLGFEFQVSNIKSEVTERIEPVFQDRWTEMNAQLAIFKIK